MSGQKITDGLREAIAHANLEREIAQALDDETSGIMRWGSHVGSPRSGDDGLMLTIDGDINLTKLAEWITRNAN